MAAIDLVRLENYSRHYPGYFAMVRIPPSGNDFEYIYKEYAGLFSILKEITREGLAQKKDNLEPSLSDYNMSHPEAQSYFYELLESIDGASAGPGIIDLQFCIDILAAKQSVSVVSYSGIEGLINRILCRVDK